MFHEFLISAHNEVSFMFQLLYFPEKEPLIPIREEDGWTLTGGGEKTPHLCQLLTLGYPACHQLLY